jgi:hypothetical protein
MNASTMISIGVLSVLVALYLLRRQSRLGKEDLD